MKKRVFFAIIIFVAIGSLLSSCAKKEDMAEEILYDLMAVSGEANEYGEIYLLGAEEGDIGYFPYDTQVMLYGEKYAELSFGKISDCAVFVSAREMCELAVFECRSRFYAEEIYEMLSDRGDIIKVALSDHPDYKEKSEKIKITIHGTYVLFAFCENTDAVEKKFRNIC